LIDVKGIEYGAFKKSSNYLKCDSNSSRFNIGIEKFEPKIKATNYFSEIICVKLSKKAVGISISQIMFTEMWW
jgi:hypothetical protein